MTLFTASRKSFSDATCSSVNNNNNNKINNSPDRKLRYVITQKQQNSVQNTGSFLGSSCCLFYALRGSWACMHTKMTCLPTRKGGPGSLRFGRTSLQYHQAIRYLLCTARAPWEEVWGMSSLLIPHLPWLLHVAHTSCRHTMRNWISTLVQC